MGDPHTVIALKHQTARHYILIGLGLTLSRENTHNTASVAEHMLYQRVKQHAALCHRQPDNPPPPFHPESVRPPTTRPELPSLGSALPPLIYRNA